MDCRLATEFEELSCMQMCRESLLSKTCTAQKPRTKPFDDAETVRNRKKILQMG